MRARQGCSTRRDLFEKAGVNPDTIETWDDFMAASKTIKEKTGALAVPMDKFKDDALFRMMLNEQGVFYFDKEGNIDLTNPKAVKAMDTIKKRWAMLVL